MVVTRDVTDLKKGYKCVDKATLRYHENRGVVVARDITKASFNTAVKATLRSSC